MKPIDSNSLFSNRNFTSLLKFTQYPISHRKKVKFLEEISSAIISITISQLWIAVLSNHAKSIHIDQTVVSYVRYFH